MDDETVLLTGASVVSPEVAAGTADTVAVRGSRIAAVGTLEAVRAALPGARYEVVDLGGGCLTPGFVDPHNHLLATGETMSGVDAGYPAVRSIADLARAVGEAALAQPAGTWVRGSGMDVAKYPEDRLPTAADLDAVSPNHPVIVFHKSGHSAVVNSVALAMAGGATGTDPTGGYFDRDETGRARGYCVDAALDLVFPRAVDIACHGPNFHFDATPEDLDHALEVGVRAYQAAGITTVCDPQVTRREMSTYLRARRAGRLGVRVVAMPLSSNLPALSEAGLSSGIGDDWFRIGAMKFYSDGALTSGTALFSGGYSNDALTRGQLFWQPGQLRELVADAMARGWQVGIHAQGDLGIEYALQAIEAGRGTGRHRVEHCGGPTWEQLGRIADLGVIPVNQPNFLTESGDELLATLGDRTHRLQPLRSELDRQILTVLSSDAFVSNYRPIRTIASAMGRETESGTVIGADERLGFGDALRMHTLLAAEALGLDGVIGSITPGKYADLVHFTTDLSDLRPAELAATTPNATMIAGRWVTGAG
ncbi:amidohydrolase [Nonomuraea sp. C10]|uniref:amidohydrolase n=1 Tax=Nonomuraea sp. C10 TaxID=2600577 RepID=UPI0011CE2D0E|nr:amidohydrolase [Nonomuraea sp. C10]TXK42213.1 amidohydrolase family protein [Nonomuraea sp. C10]